ncbi:MAG: cytochrome-c peroxidase [Bacteroidia bacterium]|nr:cytochrome-c peroxidase [Bacteroidia bacterium]
MKTNLIHWNKFLVLLVLAVFVGALGCKKQNNKENLTAYLAPQLPDQPYDYSVNTNRNTKHLQTFNSITAQIIPINNNIATLGRVIFYDKMLSINNAIACASCHKQEMAFADGEKFSMGFANMLTKRNSMAIINPIFSQAMHSGFFWDIRETELNMMVIKPVQNHIEMGFDTIANVIAKMKSVPYYANLFQKAYASNEITVDKIRESLTQFLLSMVTINSPYDLAAENNFATFTPQEFRGWEIFSKEGKCLNCHGGDISNGWVETIANIGLDDKYTDKGIPNVNRIIKNANESPSEGYFKIPSLRNIALTGPYMHDGRFSTLDQVVEHYNSGIKNHPDLHWNLRRNGTSLPIKLNLTQANKAALVAFLKTLTDKNFITDPKFSDPFVGMALN